MDEIKMIEDRLFEQQNEILEKLLADPGDDHGNPLIAGVGDVLIASTNVLRQNLSIVIDKLAAATVKIQQLETRLAEVEKRGLEYKGVHQKAQSYKRGDVCTHGGSAYVVIKDVVSDGEAPNASAGWALLVQRGRDAAGRNR